jgi:hypothetical protein
VSERTKTWLIYALPFLLGSFAFSALFSKNWGTFVGLAIASLYLFGCAWTCRRLILPRAGENQTETISLVLMIIFGGAGIAMLIGSVAVLMDDNPGGAFGLGLFGLVFTGVGYLGKRGFRRAK